MQSRRGCVLAKKKVPTYTFDEDFWTNGSLNLKRSENGGGGLNYEWSELGGLMSCPGFWLDLWLFLMRSEGIQFKHIDFNNWATTDLKFSWLNNWYYLISRLISVDFFVRLKRGGGIPQMHPGISAWFREWKKLCGQYYNIVDFYQPFPQSSVNGLKKNFLYKTRCHLFFKVILKLD